ncbi:MFS transporter [Gordonia sp. WA4-43]|uniref:MFS transporter n=2 Tax=unclassified Gordonia (in: high G+C Gram-positive bacteria) TaxID=2657482 RepID=UPI001CFA923F|nr:MFS transporter [Gordonia sp. WA4-43]UCZ88150.1 MFS transporter [Gordonia sp. WA4-43]
MRGTDRTARRREAMLLTATTSTMVLLVLDSSILGVMLPTMMRDLDLSVSQSSWLVSIYLLMLAVFAPVGGRLADAYGAATMFRVGMVGFVAASTMIAVVPSFEAVVAGRALAGVAGAVLMPATLALLIHTVDEARRPGAMAVYTGVGQGFALIGPAVGGVCAQFLTWQVGFLVNVPVGIVAVVLSVLAHPPSGARTSQSWDLPGLTLLVTGLGAAVAALLQGPAWGWRSPAVITLLVVGGVALSVFPLATKRATIPVLDIGLLRDRDFAVRTTALAAIGFAMTAATVYGAVALQEAMHLEPVESGLALLPLVIPLLAATRLVGARYERYGLQRVVVAGSLCLAAGMITVAVGFAVSSVTVIAIGLGPVGVGIGALLSPLTTATVASVPAGQRGQASGVITTGRQMGAILGVAVFAALLAAYPGRLGTAIGFLVTGALLVIVAIAAALISSGKAAE